MLSYIRFTFRRHRSLFHAKIVCIYCKIPFCSPGSISKKNCVLLFFSHISSISPRNVMIIGVSAQIVFGNLLGVFQTYVLHVLFRWLTAASCALMYTSGSTICTSSVNELIQLTFIKSFKSLINLCNCLHCSLWYNQWCGKNYNIVSIWVLLVNWINRTTDF